MNLQRKQLKLSLFLVAGISFHATGEIHHKEPQKSVKNFEEVWSSFYEHSLQKKSLEFEKKSHELSLERLKRHWLPRVYFQGQWFSTNDPGQVFFNNLGQRSIEQTDFAPSELNHPDRGTFMMGSIGLDMPLFEGGLKQNQKTMFSHLVKSAQLEMEAKKSEEYAELAKRYGQLLIYSKSYHHLVDQKSKLNQLISTYQVGARTNPVGYSGLLGLKGVRNRIEGMISEYELNMMNDKNWISKKSHLTHWEPFQSQKLKTFLNQHLKNSDRNSFSTMILSQQEKIKTLNDRVEMEKARFLPRIGLFAQNNMYSGDRDNQSSEAFGLYLQWDLFNSDSFGRVSEARAQAFSAKAKIDHYKKEETIMKTQLLKSHQVLEKNLTLLNDSDRLLKEQSQNAMKLFKSGMLNALQLAEVINRRVDLIQSRTQVKKKFLEVHSGLYQMNH